MSTTAVDFIFCNVHLVLRAILIYFIDILLIDVLCYCTFFSIIEMALDGDHQSH